MMFRKLSLNDLLYIVVMAIALSTDINAKIEWHSAINYYSNCLIPFHYNLKLNLMPVDEYDGESNATFYIHCPTQNINIHTSKYMKIMDIQLKSANHELIQYKHYFFNYNKNVIALNISEQLEYGAYTLYMKFSNSIKEHPRELFQTWYINDKGHETFIFATLLQPRRARMLFPCWDEPQLSATFNISVEHHKNYKILSNMPIREYESVDNFTKRTLFHKTPPMSTNDVAIVMYDNVGDLYVALNSTEIMVNTWCRSHLISHMKLAHYVAGNVTMYLEHNWKILKSVPKVDYIAIPNLERKIWQAWGLVLYNEADIIYNEELHSVAFKSEIMRSITHEITYQWFGNLFNPSCRSNWWLNEGFIMYFEAYFINKIFPDTRMMDLFIVQIQHESRQLNTHFDNYFAEYASDTEIKSLSPFSPIIGAIVWRMLGSLIPEHGFWMGIKAYLNAQFTFFISKTPDNLWNFMKAAIHEYYFELYNINIKKIMDIWNIQKLNCPVLNVTLDYHSGHMKISKEFNIKSDGKPYFIFVSYTKDVDPDFSLYPFACLTESTPELIVPFTKKDKWIIVNRQQKGYYRVNYDPQNWLGIARYLNSTDYTKIHVLNRAQIIDDAFHFVIEKKLNISIFWELTSYLWREKDYIAWYPMIKVFEYISNIFAFSKEEDKLPNILKEVLVKIRSIFEHIEGSMYNQTISSNHDFNRYLKQELAKWACIVGNSLCMEKANNQLQLFLRNHTINKLLPGWQKWTYCNGFKTQNSSVWSDVWISTSTVYKENFDYQILELLSCAEEPIIILDYLQFILPIYAPRMFKDNEQKIVLQTREHFYALTAKMFLSTLARHAKNITMLKILLKEFEYIKRREVSENVALNVIINNAYTEEQLIEIDKFAKNKVTKSYSNIKSKINTRSIELNNQLKCLQSLFDESTNNTNCKKIYSTIKRSTISRSIKTRPNITLPDVNIP